MPRYLACGSAAGGCAGLEEWADVSETHELRCCSDSDLGADWSNTRCNSVWAASDLDGVCHHAVGFNQGMQLCDNAGGEKRSSKDNF